jgi:tRNA 2-thiouridine synthesizing protein A
MADFHHQLDACGLNCPLPVLRAKKTLDKMDSGEVLQIIATDPGSVTDMAALARQTGHKLLESRQDSDKYYFLIEKG